MQKNEELMLKYLADLMSEKEKADFEKLLETSEQLKESFQNIQKALKEFSEIRDFKTDERYFSSLLPKIYKRIEKNRNYDFVKKISYVIPAILTAVFIIISLPSSEKFNDKLEQFTKELVNYYESRDSIPPDLNEQLYLYQRAINSFDAGFLEDEPLPKDYINKYLPLIFEETQEIENMPEEDLQILYANLNKFNYSVGD